MHLHARLDGAHLIDLLRRPQSQISMDAHWASYEQCTKGSGLSQAKSDPLWQRICEVAPRSFAAFKEHEASRPAAAHEPQQAQWGWT